MPRMWGLNADKQVQGWTSFVNRHLQLCRLVLVPTILLVQIAARAGWDYSTGGVGLRPSCHTLLDRGHWHVLGQSPVKYLFFLEWHQSGSPADDFSLVCSLALVPWCKDEASKWHAAIRIGGLVGWAEHFRKRIHTWIPYLEKTLEVEGQLTPECDFRMNDFRQATHLVSNTVIPAPRYIVSSLDSWKMLNMTCREPGVSSP